MAEFIDLNGNLFAEGDAHMVDAQVIMQGASGVPEDRFINVWHFAALKGTTTWESLETGIQFELGTFYTAISTYLSTVALGTGAKNFECRIYDITEEEPREPHPVLLGVDLGTDLKGLPNEVALCLSFFSVRNIPRRRGRIYLGPLSNTTMVPAAAGAGDRRPDPAAITALVGAGTQMLTGTNGVIWCTKSNAGLNAPVYRQVTEGWVDNAYDTQRRRGMGASTRTLFT